MGLPKYFKADSIKKKANKTEKRIMQHLVSGALDFKGDFSDEDSCMDVKSTKHKSIRVTEEMCEKIIEDSLSMNKEKAILILDLPNYNVVCKVEKK